MIRIARLYHIMSMREPSSDMVERLEKFHNEISKRKMLKGASEQCDLRHKRDRSAEVRVSSKLNRYLSSSNAQWLIFPEYDFYIIFNARLLILLFDNMIEIEDKHHLVRNLLLNRFLTRLQKFRL